MLIEDLEGQTFPLRKCTQESYNGNSDKVCSKLCNAEKKQVFEKKSMMNVFFYTNFEN